MTARSASLFFLTFCGLTAHTATYTVAPSPATREAIVEVRIEGEPSTEFRMAAWAPGDYRIVNFGRLLSNVRFFKQGEEVPAERGEDPNSWQVSSGADRVTYHVNSRTSIFTEDLRVNDREMFFNGPAVLGWFHGRQHEEHTLRILLSPVGASAFCALDPVASGEDGYATYRAPNYESLVDAPVVVGTTIRSLEFAVQGKPHWIVAYNRPQSLNLETWSSVAKRVVEETSRLYGQLPYARYLFMLDVGGPGGGLEHAASTRMAVSVNSTAQATAQFMAHEFVHTYNVKRIRPSALQPIDFTKPAVTGALWWLEGVTDYYARVVCVRAGIRTRTEILGQLGREISLLSRQPRRLQVSANESSRRVWEANNSSGFGIDYYMKGALIGFMLDLAIRTESRGERSLDDVMFALWSESQQGKAGFSETRIRELCVMFGGDALGDIYDEAVFRAVDMPWERVLRRAGLAFDDGRLFEMMDATQEASQVARNWPYRTP